MRSSIRTNYCICYLLLVCTLFLLLNTLGVRLISNRFYEKTENDLYREATFITSNYTFNLKTIADEGHSSNSSLRNRFESLQIMTNIRSWLVSENGEILLDSDSANSKEENDISSYNDTFLDNQIYRGEVSEYLLPYPVLAVIYPLSSNLNMQGYLVIMVSLDDMQAKIRFVTKTINICLIIFSILMGTVFIYLSYQTRKPIMQLSNTLQHYSNGHFEQPLPQFRNREYRQLTDNIHYLSLNPKKSDEKQRSFIANISHDLRSPLTSIKGYTEALLDGTIPPEFQKKYLNIILFEANRLTKLTQNLLVLSQYENKRIPLELSVFDINQLVRNAVMTFENQCSQKQITIDLIFSQDELLVKADRAKIAQVVQNLLDNAIKFSNTKGTIELQTQERSGKVFVSVKDFGIGIPQESLSHIWERFYKTDLSRGKDKTGTGLGLSITKEIIDAHKENINVISVEGEGTEFIFSLSSNRVGG